ncbi:hypothetical protein [Micromonospora phaseoli]|nr:hypothetical protein [Micromonospora phaseoli]
MSEGGEDFDGLVGEIRAALRSRDHVTRAPRSPSLTSDPLT